MAIFLQLYGYLGGLAGFIGLVGSENVDRLLAMAFDGTSRLFEGHVVINTQTVLAFLLLGTALGALYLSGPRRPEPLRVIRTTVKITFDKKDPMISMVERTQLIRANRPDVTACYTRARPAPGGSIPGDKMTHSVVHSGQRLTAELDKIGSDRTGWEIYHIFTKPLPYPFYGRLVPDWILSNLEDSRLPKWIARCVSRRHLTIVYKDADDQGEGYFKMEADRYNQKSVEIFVEFPSPLKQEDRKKVIVREIQSGDVVRGEPEWPKDNTCKVSASHLRRQTTLGVYWGISLVKNSRGKNPDAGAPVEVA